MGRHIAASPTSGGGKALEAAILASAATGIVGFIERLGGDIDTVFGNSGISPEMAGSTTLKLRLADFCTLFEQAALRTGCENFGLWFGNQFKPRDLGLWGYAAISAPTLGSALETLVSLFHYHQEQSSMSLSQEANGLAQLQYQIEVPDIMDRRQDAELSLGMFLNVIREACGPSWTPEEVHFEHPRTMDCYDHLRAFGAPVYFSQPTNALLFRPDILGRTMPAYDLKLMVLMQNCLEQLSRIDRGPAKMTDRVRSAVRSRLSAGYPSLDSVARDLHISPSAIRRDLAQDGTSFKGLVETTRRELAMHYLGQRHLPISEISFLLGYSELSAFSRAMRRWTGVSPTKVRQTLHAR